jgi:hypothetical protein
MVGQIFALVAGTVLFLVERKRYLDRKDLRP